MDARSTAADSCSRGWRSPGRSRQALALGFVAWSGVRLLPERRDEVLHRRDAVRALAIENGLVPTEPVPPVAAARPASGGDGVRPTRARAPVARSLARRARRLASGHADARHAGAGAAGRRLRRVGSHRAPADARDVAAHGDRQGRAAQQATLPRHARSASTCSRCASSGAGATSMARLDQARLLDAASTPLRTHPARFALGLLSASSWSTASRRKGRAARRAASSSRWSLGALARRGASGSRSRACARCSSCACSPRSACGRSCAAACAAVATSRRGATSAAVAFHVAEGGPLCPRCVPAEPTPRCRVQLGTLRALEQGLRLPLRSPRSARAGRRSRPPRRARCCRDSCASTSASSSRASASSTRSSPPSATRASA